MDWDALVLGPCMDAFGAPMSYQPRTGAPFDIVGIFDRYHADVTFNGDGVPVSTLKPILGVRQAAFPTGMTSLQGDKVLIEGILYEVTDPKPDGHGHLLLSLKLAR